MKKFRIFLLMCAVAMTICGCKYKIKFMEEETEKAVEVTTEAVTEVTTEETTTKEVAVYTDKMTMLIEKQEDELVSEHLDRIYLGDELMVAFPKNGTERSEKDKFSVEKEGVFIEFEMNPYERSGQQYTPIYESLRKIVNNYYGAGNTQIDEIETGNVEDIAVETARATVSFIDISDKKATACDSTMYLIDLDEENTMSIRLEIDYSNTTSKTEEVLLALEDYYEIDIQYDESAASKKLASYGKTNTVASNSGGGSSVSGMQTITWGNYEFEIPANWKKDNSMTTSGGVFYAPNGSVERAGYGLILTKTQGTTATVETYVNNQAEMSQLYKEFTGGMVESVTFSDAGQTFLGHTLKMTFNMNYNGVTMPCTVYSNVSTTKMEMIAVYGISGSVSAAESVLQEIMRNGRTR